MSRKQWSWRCSNQALSIILIFSFHTHTFSMDYAYGAYERWKRPTESSSSSAPFSNSKERPDLWTEEEKRTRRYEGATWGQMMQAYEGAPREVKHIVDHLNNPDKFKDDDYRAAFFQGPPGSGKTTAAKAVPHVANWYPYYFVSTELEGIHRNEGSKALLSAYFQL